MKLSLPIKLGIFVLVLFALVIATCLLWTPVKVQYYVGKVKSDDPKERVAGVDGLIGMGEKGVTVLSQELRGGAKEAHFLKEYWQGFNKPVKDNQYKRYPLHLAAKVGFIDAAQLFISKGAEIDTKDTIGCTPLHTASVSGHKEIVSLLLSKGAEVNWQSDLGRSPLHWSASNGHYDTTVLLISEGADVNAGDTDGSPPLHWAASNGHKSIVSLLIEKGAKVDKKDHRDRTSLFLAAGNGRKEIALLLISKGAEVNAKDVDFWTPLHIAAAGYGYKDIVSLLIRKGAGVNGQTNDNETPLDLAETEGMKSLLRSHGAKTGEELGRSTEYRVPSTEKEEKK
ncbi:MAG: ankyrin repeat domain-containing protein [Planctomycetota bacterium]|nr:MAG: ankyrin repeat domain-containing protein [Planctomycetota bacterium]